jgi:multidrug resistance efflux pump
LEAETDRSVNIAIVGQRENEVDLAGRILVRCQRLFQQKTIDQNQLDKDQARRFATAEAAIAAAASKIDKVKADIAEAATRPWTACRPVYKL